MMQTPPHTKVRTVREFADGRVEVDSHSTYKSSTPNTVKQEIGQNIETSVESLPADVMRCLRHITEGETKELTIKIEVDRKTGLPALITKTWLVNKEYYGR